MACWVMEDSDRNEAGVAIMCLSVPDVTPPTLAPPLYSVHCVYTPLITLKMQHLFLEQCVPPQKVWEQQG